MSQLWTEETVTGIDQWWNRYRGRRERCENSHVEVFVRSYVPAPGTHETRNRFLERLTDALKIRTDSFGTTLVGDGLCRCAQCRRLKDNRALLETITDLASWQYESLRASGFLEREVRATVTNETHTVVVPPELAVGVYLDESLVGVFPCKEEDTGHTPREFLQGLTSGPLEHADKRRLATDSGSG